MKQNKIDSTVRDLQFHTQIRQNPVFVGSWKENLVKYLRVLKALEGCTYVPTRNK